MNRAPKGTTPEVQRRRISMGRLFVVGALSIGLVAAASGWAFKQFTAKDHAASATWSAPYVDVTLTPEFHFEDPAAEPNPNVVLGFVVADKTDACTPSWGTYYSLDAAARALDLDRRIVRLRESGGDAIVSFGGAINNELAESCTDATKLQAAYQSVIDRYNLTAVDFDIEGSALSNTDANARRITAIKGLQGKDSKLAVWLTLPVTPQGLTSEGAALVQEMLDDGVKLAGVNVMTMDFGGSRPAGMTMAAATESALTATFTQVSTAYHQAGVTQTADETWQHIGATPMIGQNDVPSEVFTTGDAQSLMAFAAKVKLGRISFWSANRDVECGAAVTDNRASNTCSGVSQQPLQFTNIFRNGTAASLPGSATSTQDAAKAEGTTTNGMALFDPATSPYPLWRDAKAYVAGDKVVWQARVYQAKWWTQGDQPDAPVQHTWDTPWQYLGPVLESDRQAVANETPAAAGTYLPWSAEKVFVAGDKVEYQDKIYEARWWTQGDMPQQYPDQPYDNPWTYLGKAPTSSGD